MVSTMFLSMPFVYLIFSSHFTVYLKWVQIVDILLASFLSYKDLNYGTILVLTSELLQITVNPLSIWRMSSFQSQLCQRYWSTAISRSTNIGHVKDEGTDEATCPVLHIQGLIRKTINLTFIRKEMLKDPVVHRLKSA